MGAAGLLAEARNLPARNDNQLLSGMPSNQAMMESMGFHMKQLNDRLKVDFPAEQHAFTTGKSLASNIRTEHQGNQESIKADFQKHDVRGIFVHGYKEGKENAFNELGDFKNLQSKLNEVSGGKGQQVTDSQSAGGMTADTTKFGNPAADKFTNKDQLAGGKLDLSRGNSEMTARAALILGDLTNKPNGAQSADEFGRMIKFVEGRLNNSPTESQKQNNDKSVELTRNQYDAMNVQHRTGTEQHIFNAYIANLAGSVIDKLTHNEHHSDGMLAHSRHNGSQTEKVDQQTGADKRMANDKVQQDERVSARSRQEGELAAQRNATEKENNIKNQERAQDKQARQDGSEKTNNNAAEQQRSDRIVHDPSASQESAEASDSVTRALTDLTGLLTNISDTTKEKFKLQPILKLKMLMKMRTQIMQKFRLMWKAKSKLLDKLKLKKQEKAKAKLKVLASRQKQSNQRRGELQRSESRRSESSKRQRDAQREDRQPSEPRTDVRKQDRQRLEARRTSMRQTDSRVANLDAARTLRQAVVSRSEAAPQHHVTEVSCVGRPTQGMKQSLFGPMNCGNPTGIVKIPQLTDASCGVSTAVTTTARRA
jgi:hypothetical protein